MDATESNMMWKLNGQMDKGGHYDVQISGLIEKREHFDVQMKRWMEKGAL